LNDPFDLQRFVDAQNPIYDSVRAELTNGRKQGHWMWFIFPQLRGLGHSEMANYFGISSREEAKAYLNHPVLGPRLRECTGFINLVNGRTVNEILGYPDELKFKSSMTLFASVTDDNQEFKEALEKYY
jgi:uncharacterized protein (DUF1810 family)